MVLQDISQLPEFLHVQPLSPQWTQICLVCFNFPLLSPPLRMCFDPDFSHGLRGLRLPKVCLTAKDRYEGGYEYSVICVLIHKVPCPVQQVGPTLRPSSLLPPPPPHCSFCHVLWTRRGPFLPGRDSLHPTPSSVMSGCTITPGPCPLLHTTKINSLVAGARTPNFLLVF